MTTEDDNLTLALAGLDREVAAVAAFDAARDSLVDLIEVRADPAAIFNALDQVHERQERIRTSYYALERHFISCAWSMEERDSLPAQLRQAIEAELPHHQEHVRKTAEAEAIVDGWLMEQGQEYVAWRYWARRRATEDRHSRRAHRRRRGG
jgi:hypothetical protein